MIPSSLRRLFCVSLLVPMQALAGNTSASSQPALSQELAGRIETLKKKAISDLVFVEGGRFQMGDFGPIHSEEKLPYTSQPENKPLHWVELDSFSLSRHKVTYEDFDVFTDANKKPRIAMALNDKPYREAPNVPAGLNWPEAKAYCKWLGKLTGLPFGLPTEAQWEYAARNRGQMLLWPTDNAMWEARRNVPDDDQLGELMPNMSSGEVFAFPLGRFPPSPLGLYDMTANGSDWVEDWFSEKYYEVSPEKNPRGPARGKKKVFRGIERDPETGLTFYRQNTEPQKKVRYRDSGEVFTDRWPNISARCAVQSSRPVSP